MEISRAFNLYMEYCRSKQLRQRTMISYEQTIKLFIRWLKEVEGIDQIEQIKEVTIRHYILELQARGKYTFYADIKQESTNHPKRRRDYRKPVGNITINNYLRNLSPFFTWLVDIEYISKSPMRKVKALPQERKAKEYLEDEEVRKLLNNMDTSYFSEYRDMICMMIMLDSGTRLGETLSIEMHQIDLINRTIQLPAEKTKGRTARTVFFSRKTEKELRRWLQFKDRYCESDYAFPVKYSGEMLTVPRYEANFRRYLERSGITKHISPHTLRNNFAKRCLMAGMDIYTLSRILGHSSVTVTEQAYLDVKDEDLKKKYLKYSPLDRIF